MYIGIAVGCFLIEKFGDFKLERVNANLVYKSLLIRFIHQIEISLKKNFLKKSLYLKMLPGRHVFLIHVRQFSYFSSHVLCSM